MKKMLFLFFALPFITSCYHYRCQVFQVKADNLKYSNEDCSVTYNFWCDKGNPGFIIYNRTDKNIYIDLNKTHFIRNGVAYDYFLNREWQIGNNVAALKSVQGTFYNTGFSARIGDGPTYSATASIAVTNSKSITNKEKDIICIPPKSNKYFAEYTIVDIPYSDCDSKNCDKKRWEFSEDNSPLTFSNVIAYWKEDDNTYNYIENKFYVESIEVVEETKLFPVKKIEDPCANKIDLSTIAPLYALERFYLKYKYRYKIPAQSESEQNEFDW